MSKFPWEAAFLDRLVHSDIPGIISVLGQQATDHAGTPNAAVKRHALKLLRKHGTDLLSTAMALSESDSITAHELAAILLGERYAEAPDMVTARLRHLADSPNWEVREWVASGCGIVLGAHFSTFYPAMQDWVQDPSGNVRRAVVLAVMYASAQLPPGTAEAQLALLAPLMADRDAYVKKNLAAFAIGDALLRRYPEAVLPWLTEMVRNEDEQVRWNVANVFVAAAAADFALEAEPILAALEADGRPAVQRAVKSARKALAKRVERV